MKYYILFITLSIGIVHSMIYIKDIQVCPESKVKISFTDKGKGSDGKQIVDLTADVPVPVDDMATAGVTIYSDADGSWKQTFKIPKRLKACASLEVFFGQIWHDLQKHSGIEPGTCPIQGTLKFDNYAIDSDHIKFPMLPKGLVNITSDVRDKDNNLITCNYFIVNNE